MVLFSLVGPAYVLHGAKKAYRFGGRKAKSCHGAGDLIQGNHFVHSKPAIGLALENTQVAAEGFLGPVEFLTSVHDCLQEGCGDLLMLGLFDQFRYGAVSPAFRDHAVCLGE
ncbi:hypothetical protein GTY68_27390 [Streptomyces sp. SID4926]|nr:hypothetical protein [Streptomyces sp. SID4926]MYQ60901.1 hypothetical protein [Streptomyces sp. SID4926]